MQGIKVFCEFCNMFWLNFHLDVLLVDRFSLQAVFEVPARNKAAISNWLKWHALFYYVL